MAPIKKYRFLKYPLIMKPNLVEKMVWFVEFWQFPSNCGNWYFTPGCGHIPRNMELAITSTTKRFPFCDTFPLYIINLQLFSSNNPGRFRKYETEKNIYLWFFSRSKPLQLRCWTPSTSSQIWPVFLFSFFHLFLFWWLPWWLFMWNFSKRVSFAFK